LVIGAAQARDVAPQQKINCLFPCFICVPDILMLCQQTRRGGRQMLNVSTSLNRLRRGAPHVTLAGIKGGTD
jgi:hypothetical protein